MSGLSDNDNKPRTNIFELLPEVYRSDVNKTVFENSFNRHLTKDDAKHVAGFVGQGNPNSLVNNQLPEPTPQRQAFQLQPTMYDKVGNVEHVTSFETFQSELELMGVDFTRMQEWGTSLEFNWIPPVNIDMLTNFQDYYWAPSDPTAEAQYLTIENLCAKQQAILASYNNLVAHFGSTFTIIAMDVVNNTLTVTGNYTALFVNNFQIFITNTTDININGRFFLVSSSVFNSTLNQTTITLNTTNSSIAIRSATTPPPSVVGRYWVNTTLNVVNVWNGSAWVLVTPLASGTISLSEVVQLIQRDTNCICSGDFGWDLALWDDNTGDWSAPYLAPFAFPNEADWITANGLPTPLAVWFCTSNDVLYQRNQANTAWVPFSPDIPLTGDVFWDLTTACFNNLQVLNQWSLQNKWIHKTQVQSFANIIRAQLPILEYDSRIELNTWTETTYAWKYRSLAGLTFGASTTNPTKLELEPVKNYTAVLNGGQWYLYLDVNLNEDLDNSADDAEADHEKDFDWTEIFVPGFQFRLRDDGALNQVYTVDHSVYEELPPIQPTLLTRRMVTIVKIVEPFTGPLVGFPTFTRIEPLFTSKGDFWRGYHVHWVLTFTDPFAATPPTDNPLLKRSEEVRAPYAFTGVTSVGQTTVGQYFQQTTVNGVGVTNLCLDVSFLHSDAYALAITNVSPGVWQVLGDYTDLFTPCASFTITDNRGISGYNVVDTGGGHTGSSPTGLPPGSLVGWDPVTVTNDGVLSNGNLTFSSGALSTGVQGAVGKSSGKWYWEITVGQIGPWYPAISPFEPTDEIIMTAHFDSSSFVYSPPVGYNALPTGTTWDPFNKGPNVTLSNGNLTADIAPPFTPQAVRATSGMLSGKWYWEVHFDAAPGFFKFPMTGILSAAGTLNNYLGSDCLGYGNVNNNSLQFCGATIAAGGSPTIAIGDIQGVAFDADNGTLKFYLNGVYIAVLDWNDVAPGTTLAGCTGTTLDEFQGAVNYNTPTIIGGFGGGTGEYTIINSFYFGNPSIRTIAQGTDGLVLPVRSRFWVPGDVFGFALDLDTGILSVQSTDIPLTAIANTLSGQGTFWPAIAFNSASLPNCITANFGASPFHFSPPAGYHTLDGPVIYTANITIDGTTYPVSVQSDLNRTYAELLTTINLAIHGGVASLDGSGNIRITSLTTGSTSSVVIADTGGSGYNVVEVGGNKTNASLTNLVGVTTYTATITVDSIHVQSISVLGSSVSTFGDLITAINTQLGGFATAALVGGNIKVTSTTTVPSSRVIIVNTGTNFLFATPLNGFVIIDIPVVPFLFANLTGFITINPPVAGINGGNGVYSVASGTAVFDGIHTNIFVDETIPVTATASGTIITGKNAYALAGQNMIRVYVNGIRQYGNYTEITSVNTRGEQVVDVGSNKLSTDPTNLVALTTYTATITIDGTHVQPISVLGSSAVTFGTLIAELTAQLGGFATAALVGGNIKVTSVTGGAPSTVSIVNSGPDPLFAAPLNDFVAINAAIDGTTVTGTHVIDYTAVGNLRTSTQTVTYVLGIQFTEPVKQYDIVRIEVGPAALPDMGLGSVPVRTVEDEIAFQLAVISGTQPTYKNITTFDKNEQVKTNLNQYPLFDVYDIGTNSVIKATSLFQYEEDQTQPIDPNIQKRIIISGGGTDYSFEQTLVEKENGELFAFRLYDGRVPVGSYWFNPFTQILKYWDGSAWEDDVVFKDLHGNFFVVEPYVQETPPPVYAVQRVGSLWYDTINKVVKQANGVAWIPIAYPEFKNPTHSTTPQGLLIEGADPTLTTIWRSVDQYSHNSSGPWYTWTAGFYQPQWVDKDRNVLVVGDPNGDWEIPEQWRFNVEHHNKQFVNYSELVTHFSQIINAQPQVLNFPEHGTYTKTQAEYEYWLEGTIKEFNDSYDTLMSAVNETNVTPLGVINFAREQYNDLSVAVKDIYVKTYIQNFTDTSVSSIVDISEFVETNVINNYEENEFYGQVYIDTSAFDPQTGNGVRHWIATAPMFGLAHKFRPHQNIDTKLGILEIVHHDGHRSEIDLSASETDSLSRKLLTTPDPRVPSGKFGASGTTPPPTTKTAFNTALGTIRSGVYWYNLSNPRTLYRFDIIAATGIAPSFFNNGVQLPDGTFYYNTTSNTLYTKVGLSWNVVTVLGDGVITSAWMVVDFRDVLADVILEIENRLYAVTPAFDDLVFAFETLAAANIQDQALFDQLNKEQFFAYVIEQEIQTPFANTQFNQNDPFTWNYINSLITTVPTLSVNPPISASWQQLYTTWYRTPYPHLEPWALQGYTEKPTWWDGQYLNNDPLTYGNRRWKYIHSTTTGMWQNIKIGNVPLGQPYPDGKISTGNSVADAESLPTYNYFSVNISDATISGGFVPDDLLPPFYSTVSVEVRSLFSNYNAEIVAPAADYAYGEGGPVEWQWLTSTQHIYDPQTIAFKMQPVRFMHYAFGPRFVRVNNLQVETLFDKVYAHEDALFHGDIYNTNTSYLVRGLNQWYVDRNRYVGYDTNKEFRALWVSWQPLLTHLFANIIDANTLLVTNKFYDVGQQDYKIVLTDGEVIQDLWVDAFEVVILSMPPQSIQYNNENLWKLQISSLASVPRAINYYDVQRIPIVVDVTTNIATIFKYNIISAVSLANQLQVAGDHSTDFVSGVSLTVSNSSGNNGTYTAAGSIYDASINATRITTNEPILSSVGDGIIDIPGEELPWITGDVVFVSSSKSFPAPIIANNAYYIIKISSREFQLSFTPSDPAIVFTSAGTGDLSVNQVGSSFTVFGAQISSETPLWYHYTINKLRVRTLQPTQTFAGIQRLIDILDGYAAYQQDRNVVYNLGSAGEIDPVTGRAVGWQLEEERFINFATHLRRTNVSISDRFNFVVSSTSLDELSFVGPIPVWAPETAVVVSSSSTLPNPLIPNTPYYVVPTATPGIFQLSVSQFVTPTSIVDITSTGSGTLTISQFKRLAIFPSFEINPTRNNVWINTPQGVLSNIIEGPFPDIHITQTIFDQYGRPLTGDKLLVFREDKQSHIAIVPGLPNDVVPASLALSDPYNFIHIGGGHFFVQGFEHAIIFNNYTVSGDLIYDQFDGLNTPRFNLDFFEKTDNVFRPTLGGFFLLNNQFVRNMEGQTIDLQHIYDTFLLPENTEFARRSRNLLGYQQGSQPYLDLLGVNAKSQFLFYKGMIHEKGSVNSVTAFLNARQFIGAQLDEYWAWKLAEFGDIRPKVYPEIKLFASDGTLNDVRLEFLTNGEAQDSVTVSEDEANGFEIITFMDPTRWINFPEQRTLLHNSILFLDGKVSSLTQIYSAPCGSQVVDVGSNKTSASLTNLAPATTYTATITIDGVHVQPISVLGSAVSTFGDLITALNTQLGGFATAALIGGNIQVTSATVVGSTSTVLIVNSGVNFLFAAPLNGFVAIDIPVPGQPPLPGQETLVNYWYDSTTNKFKVWNGTAWVVQTGIHKKDGTDLYIKLPVFCDTVRVVQRTLTIPRDLREYTTSFMNQGTGLKEFSIFNSEVVRFDVNGFTDIIQLYTINPADTKITPAKIIDYVAGAVISNVPVWHPAIGDHYYLGLQNIDLQNSVDPASYTVSDNVDNNPKLMWNAPEVGTVWFDTSFVGYIPYYDAEIFPNINDRLYNWGVLADWADIKIYRWTASPVPPSNYNATVASQSSDLTIPQNQKLTGTPRQTVFFRSRTPLVASVPGFPTTEITVGSGHGLSVDDQVLLTIASTSGLQTVNVGGTATDTSSTGLLPATLYTSAIAVDGKAPIIIDVVDQPMTFGDLINEINSQLGTAAVASIVGGNIQVTSVTTGSTSSISIVDGTHGSQVVDVGGAHVNADPTNLIGGTTYTATITIDGIHVQPISVLGSTVTTFGALVSAITTQLGGFGTAALVNGNIQVTSNLVGPLSTVSIVNSGANFLFAAPLNGFVAINAAVVGIRPLFGSLTGFVAIDPAVLGVNGVFPTTPVTPLETSFKYSVIATTSTTIQIGTDTGATPILFTSDSTGAFSVVPAFTSSDWIEKPLARQRYLAVIDLTSFVDPVFTVLAPFVDGDKVNVYVNGKLKLSSLTVIGGTVTATGLTVTGIDIIDIVRPIHALTDTESQFNPDVTDNGTTDIQWSSTMEYSQVTLTVGGNPLTTYYFWVEDATTIDSAANVEANTALAPIQVSQQMITIPVPYLVVQKPLDDPALADIYGYGVIFGEIYSVPWIYDIYPIIPVFYRQAVIRNAANFLNVDNRYELRFTRDLTLRDNLNDAPTPMNLKDKHEEWLLIRRAQENTIDRTLWDRLTEAIVGYKLADPTIRVPSLERTLYDASAGTDTQYGLGVDQAFANGQFALDTVLAYLEDPNNNFYPVDINSFFQTYSFDTPEDIVIAMDAVYNTFNTKDVNNIWFNTLLDAFSTKAKYREFMKTSWVALHGIQIFNVNGIFDN